MPVGKKDGRVKNVVYKKNLAIVLLLLAASVFAHDDFSQAQALIKSNAPCSQLTDVQLEEMGDYFMEQMHPGELHAIMEDRMGGEGSASLKLAHANLAKTFYCGDNTAMPMNMMNSMMGRSSMMGSNNYYAQPGGMMSYYSQNNFEWDLTLLIAGAVVASLAWFGYYNYAKKKRR